MQGIINTLENMFTSLYLVGENKYIEDYLKNNNKINFFSIKTLSDSNGKYVLNGVIRDDSVVIFTSKYKRGFVTDKNGRPCYACFLNKDDKNPDFCNKYIDINNYIVKRLRSNGVKVIRAYCAHFNDLNEKKSIKWTMRFWILLRLLFPKIFALFRCFINNNAYILKDVSRATNDMSRGFSIMYGNGKYINFDDGFRRTIGCKNLISKKNIYIFGACFIRGLSWEDNQTLPSLIQKNFPEYKVWNYGSDLAAINLTMRIPEYKPEDIVIMFFGNSGEFNVYDVGEVYDFFYNMTDSFNAIPKLYRHIFDNLLHYDCTVNEKIANDLSQVIRKIISSPFKNLTAQNYTPISFGRKIKRVGDIKLFEKDETLLNYIENISNTIPYMGNKRGAIVMNCNPFTMGHRYLIETARKMVDELFVFILQENKQSFSFKDRYMLVKKGTEDISKCYVFPAGKHIISNQTLPGYFKKNELKDTIVDMSLDLNFFVKIANALHITDRFAGEEPLDPFTCRYNEKMSYYLPRYGINFHEIKRLKIEDDVVSASRVRKLILDRNYDEIKKIVPAITYEFLVKRGHINK